MGKNEAKKTIRFWIITGIGAIAASQLPLLIKNKQRNEEDQAQQQQKKKPKWTMFLIGAILLGVILWMFDYFL